jgi:hypothetical protein
VPPKQLAEIVRLVTEFTEAEPGSDE